MGEYQDNATTITHSHTVERMAYAWSCFAMLATWLIISAITNVITALASKHDVKARTISAEAQKTVAGLEAGHLRACVSHQQESTVFQLRAKERLENAEREVLILREEIKKVGEDSYQAQQEPRLQLEESRCLRGEHEWLRNEQARERERRSPIRLSILSRSYPKPNRFRFG